MSLRFRFLDSLLRRRSPVRILGASRRPAELLTILVSHGVVQASLDHLKRAGGGEREEFVFWSGHTLDNERAVVTRAFLPRTVQGRGYVSVEDDEQLLAMTDLVHEKGELVLCQLHSHPGEAFHSEADDRGAFADEVGFLSLVLPDFGSVGLESAEVYRRTLSGWQHQGRVARAGLINTFEEALHFENGGWYGC